MTRLLVSTIVREARPLEISGYLYTVDRDECAVRERTPFIEAPLRDIDPNPRGGMRGARGIAVNGDEVYVANFSAVYRFDTQWRCLGVISHRDCADIHDIAVHDGSLWVTSTRNDMLMEFDREGTLRAQMSLRDSVGPGDGLPDSISQPWNGTDFRDPRTHDKTQHDFLHVNSLVFAPDDSLVVSLGQVAAADGPQSRLVRLNPHGGSELASELDGATVPRHNALHLPDGSLLLNDTPRGELVLFDSNTGAERNRIAIGAGYLRGLAQLEDGRIATGAQQQIALVDTRTQDPPKFIRLSHDPRESVHSIVVLPWEFAGLPECLYPLA
ncbi:MAG: hypothetical protein IT365_00780 [Candidatus Hydrogenedentes bacterium]|nr:hypothetical protein [Candidatus Hydrogenedentota bacterium]